MLSKLSVNLEDHRKSFRNEGLQMVEEDEDIFIKFSNGEKQAQIPANVDCGELRREFSFLFDVGRRHELLSGTQG